jgi:hypothetical protein
MDVRLIVEVGNDKINAIDKQTMCFPHVKNYAFDTDHVIVTLQKKLEALLWLTTSLSQRNLGLHFGNSKAGA